jgi:hypothetical protein
LDVVHEFNPQLITIGFEIDEERFKIVESKKYHSSMHCDALTESSTLWAADVIIMNPPYKLAMEFVEHAIESAGVTVCLLRLAFLASQKRAAFWREHPADVYVLPKRPSFTGGGTDSTDYAWFVWSPLQEAGNRWFILDT